MFKMYKIQFFYEDQSNGVGKQFSYIRVSYISERFSVIADVYIESFSVIADVYSCDAVVGISALMELEFQ